MMPVWWMVGACVVSWALLSGAQLAPHPETVFGMLAPLVSATATWVVTSRVHAAAPERVTGVMVAGLGAKMVFFGVYVAVMLRGVSLRPTPFVVSFAGYFIALHAMEALFLRRLFLGHERSTPSESDDRVV